MFVPTDWKPTPRNCIFWKYPKMMQCRQKLVGFQSAGTFDWGSTFCPHSVHTLHISKPNVTRVATQWTASVHTLHMSKPNVTRVATQWTASVHTLHMSKPNVTRVATQWTASVHTLHMSKPNVTRVATQWTASVHTLHMSKPNVTRVQSATQWIASVHTLHMSKPNVTRVQSATQWTASAHTLHMSKPNVTRVQSATQWIASVHTLTWSAGASSAILAHMFVTTCKVEIVGNPPLAETIELHLLCVVCKMTDGVFKMTDGSTNTGSNICLNHFMKYSEQIDSLAGKRHHIQWLFSLSGSYWASAIEVFLAWPGITSRWNYPREFNALWNMHIHRSRNRWPSQTLGIDKLVPVRVCGGARRFIYHCRDDSTPDISRPTQETEYRKYVKSVWLFISRIAQTKEVCIHFFCRFPLKQNCLTFFIFFNLLPKQYFGCKVPFGWLWQTSRISPSILYTHIQSYTYSISRYLGIRMILWYVGVMIPTVQQESCYREEDPTKWNVHINWWLGGGYTDFLFPSLFGELIQFG